MERGGWHWTGEDWFCHGVLDGTRPVKRVYENAEAVAFLHPREHEHPDHAAHALVIPKRHVETLLDLGPQDGPLVMGMLQAVREAATALGLDDSGFYLRVNFLPPYQHTGHLHWHLIAETGGH